MADSAPDNPFPQPASRRAVLGLLGLSMIAGRAFAMPDDASAWPTGVMLEPAEPFSFDLLAGRASALAGRAYAPRPAPPASLTEKIGYDAFRRAVYRPDAILWGDTKTTGVSLFPLSANASKPVAVHVVRSGFARRVRYDPALFDLPADSPVAQLGPDAGFSGFKAIELVRRAEWLAALGASYFRSPAPLGQYGLSARGLAIDTAVDTPEEFPDFTEFWLEPTGGLLTIYALLESQSVVGAYCIRHENGPGGLIQDVTVQLTFRNPVKRLGVAPLTSMYWYGASDRPAQPDWRPQLHDSDGLAIWTGAGERIWRPLSNPAAPQVNSFLDRSPRGFGLMQRDRNFSDYQDKEAFYHLRPSTWVEPIGDWGAGSVQLVELPTGDETADNIVAFWTPEAPVISGQVLNLRYRLYWTDEEPNPVGVARVVATRAGRGGQPGQPPTPGRRRYAIDFADGPLAGLAPDDDVEPVVTLSEGQPNIVSVEGLTERPGRRLIFDVDAPQGRPLDMRAFLRREGAALTETWLSQIPPA